jgi:hypothetical protein
MSTTFTETTFSQTSVTETVSAPAPAGSIDARGPQFAATLTVVVLAAVLLLPTPWATGLLAAQAALFAIGAALGVQATPHAWLFRRVVRPRLAPATEWEAPEPPRFAQAVGLGFALAGLAGFALGAPLVAQVAVGAALAAALLNALFRFCLGCEVYLLARQYAFN